VPSNDGKIEGNARKQLSKRPSLLSIARALTLALFVLGVGTNDHHPTVTANHPALVTHFLD
tara:strand:- start:1757 stop:1939 length:183 start_codon:yes stop_codon:yes gene_type:complete